MSQSQREDVSARNRFPEALDTDRVEVRWFDNQGEYLKTRSDLVRQEWQRKGFFAGYRMGYADGYDAAQARPADD
jgi:hypothetical protein